MSSRPTVNSAAPLHQRLNPVVNRRRAPKVVSRPRRELSEMEALSDALGIQDAAVLKAFLAQGLGPATAPAIDLVPVVFVAWARPQESIGESAATIEAVHEMELRGFPETWHVIQNWLDIRPGQELWDLWVRYMQCRLGSMSVEQRKGLHKRMRRQAYFVAKASGGWVGIGPICKEEQEVLDQIDTIFKHGVALG